MSLPAVYERLGRERRRAAKSQTEALKFPPLTDIWDVLALLVPSWGDETTRYISMPLDGAERHGLPTIPMVEILHYSRRGDHCGTDHYPVAPEVVQDMRARHWVKGKPEWGYTDQNIQLLTEIGKQEHYDHEKETHGSDSSTPTD